MNKDLINSRFAKHLKDYNKNAKTQKKMAEKLITLCSRKKYKNIIEIGCGTGFLTELISKNIEFETYTAIDIVKECEPYIKKINENINFINVDIEDINKFKSISAQPFDLIISNAALQWTTDFENTVKELQKVLSKNGELIFSTFGKENFREIFYALGTSLKYYSEYELKEMFPNSTIYPQEVHIMSFSSPKDVLKHLQLTGVNSLENKTWTKKDLKNFENIYSSLCIKVPTLTYNPIYIKHTNTTVR